MMSAVEPDSPPADARAPDVQVSAFERLVAEHHARVSEVVSRLLGWPPDVGDVVQDVFVKAFEGLSSFEERSGAETWLIRIAINTCRTHQRRRLVRLSHWKQVWEAASRGWRNREEDPAIGIDRPDRGAAIRRAVQRLPATYREVVVLRYLEEWSIDEIAAALGLRRNTVEVRLTRAKERLRSELQGEWDEK